MHRERESRQRPGIENSDFGTCPVVSCCVCTVRVPGHSRITTGRKGRVGKNVETKRDDLSGDLEDHLWQVSETAGEIETLTRDHGRDGGVG